jgi:hypothetical protein
VYDVSGEYVLVAVAAVDFVLLVGAVSQGEERWKHGFWSLLKFVALSVESRKCCCDHEVTVMNVGQRLGQNFDISIVILVEYIAHMAVTM